VGVKVGGALDLLGLFVLGHDASSVLFLVEEAVGADGGGVHDARDLRTQELLLAAVELRVGDQSAVEVAGEDVLDVLGLCDVDGGDVGQALPVAGGVAIHELSVLVEVLVVLLVHFLHFGYPQVA